MDLKVEKEIFDAIAAEIYSADSPVGIDAQKTHVIILKKLMDIEKRLKALEEKV